MRPTSGGARRRTRDNDAPAAATCPRGWLSARARAVLREALGTQISPVVAWLDRLRLLEPIGTEHLVTDERMLPPESIRFFHVDGGWIRAAVDGVLSIGVGPVPDEARNGLAAAGTTPPSSDVLTARNWWRMR